jgi:uncharacterized protein
MKVVDDGRRSLASRWLQLLVGLFGFGLSIPLMIRSGLGLGPWDAFHLGINRLTGISVGTASILVGLVIVLGGVVLGIRPGPGTIANMILVGVFIDLTLPWIPPVSAWAYGLAYYAVAIGISGICTGMYIAAGLGNGPRDGLMIGLSRWRGWPVRRTRTAIEVFVLLAGWLMGGTIGVGTVIFALSIGPAVQAGLHAFGALPPVTPKGSESGAIAGEAPGIEEGRA